MDSVLSAARRRRQDQQAEREHERAPQNEHGSGHGLTADRRLTTTGILTVAATSRSLLQACDARRDAGGAVRAGGGAADLRPVVFLEADTMSGEEGFGVRGIDRQHLPATSIHTPHSLLHFTERDRFFRRRSRHRPSALLAPGPVGGPGLPYEAADVMQRHNRPGLCEPARAHDIRLSYRPSVDRAPDQWRATAPVSARHAGQRRRARVTAVVRSLAVLIVRRVSCRAASRRP
ncbi:hypothetical protein ACVMB0_003548 [Bradyrhizobium sp. USDA 4451]